jgi:PhoPQ-activated pathogenicity-related protein
MKTKFLTGLLLTLLISGCTLFNKPVTPETALENYLRQKERSFSWEIKKSYEMEGVKVTDLRMISQTWRSIAWAHQLTIISHPENEKDAALLFITGGSNKDGEPNWKDENEGLFKMLVQVAIKNKGVVAILRQVPNQPLYNDLTEDALISFTLHNFKSDRDYTWPLLFPMVRSATAAMDAIQEYSSKEMDHKIKRFVISGASKRGWTTWLTGSQDERVIAIAPMVIDVLNMPVNVAYQKEVWGDYSAEISDYVDLGIAQDFSTPDGRDLTTMIDPYSYREKLVMPKMIIMGTNDPYWPADAIKNYLYEIPGENYLHYEPNAGHDLGDGKGAMQSLSAFFSTAVSGKAHPECKWHAGFDKEQTDLMVNASPELLGANLWFCNSDDQDFRDNQFYSAPVEVRNTSEFNVIVKHPATGFRAFYVELVYPDPFGGVYSKCTRMFVADSLTLYLD